MSKKHRRRQVRRAFEFTAQNFLRQARREGTGRAVWVGILVFREALVGECGGSGVGEGKDFVQQAFEVFSSLALRGVDYRFRYNDQNFYFCEPEQTHIRGRRQAVDTVFKKSNFFNEL